MAESPKITDVILEISEEISKEASITESVTEEVVIDTVTKPILTDFETCGDVCNYNSNFNNFGGYMNQTSDKFADLRITNVQWVVASDTMNQGYGPNNGIYDLDNDVSTITLSNVTYNVTTGSYPGSNSGVFFNPNSLIVFDFEKPDGSSPGFDGLPTCMAFNDEMYRDNVPTAPEDNFGPGQNREKTEQGRLLYLYGKATPGDKPTTWFNNKCISFEILEGSGSSLICRAKGIGKSQTANAMWNVFTDNANPYGPPSQASMFNSWEYIDEWEDISQVIPEQWWSVGMLNGEPVYNPMPYLVTFGFLKNFRGYITPWEHSPNWRYEDGSLRFDNSARTAFCSLHQEYEVVDFGGGDGYIGNAWLDSYNQPYTGGQIALDGGTNYNNEQFCRNMLVSNFGGDESSEVGDGIRLPVATEKIGMRYTGNPFNVPNCDGTTFTDSGERTKGYRIKISVPEMDNCKVYCRFRVTPDEYYQNYLNEGSTNINGINGEEEYAFALEYLGATQTYTNSGASSEIWGFEISEPGEYEFDVPFWDAYLTNSSGQTAHASGAVFNGMDMDAGNDGAYANTMWPKWFIGNPNTYGSEGKFTILHVDPVDAYQPMSCTIDKIELTKGGYLVKTMDIDITQEVTTETTESRRWTDLKYDVLDILESDKVPLSLNFYSADVREPGKRATGFSKTFQLPASKRNQRILKSMTADNSRRQRKDISWRRARIKSNGIYVFNGYARIERMSTGKGGTYSCHIIQDPSFWPERLGEKKLCDLKFEMPGQEHVKDFATVTSSWNQVGYNGSITGYQNPEDFSGQPYQYPLISYGKWSNGSNSVIPLTDFHPAIYTKAVVEAIFSQIQDEDGNHSPYNVVSSFFSSAFFRKLIIPYTSGEDYRLDTFTMGEDGDWFGHASKSGGVDLPNIPGSTDPNVTRRYCPNIPTEEGIDLMFPNIDGEGEPGYVQDGYTVPFTGRYKIYYSAQVKFKNGNGGGNVGRWAAWVHVNGQVMGINSAGFEYPSYQAGYLYSLNTDSGPDGTDLEGQQMAIWYGQGYATYSTEFLECEVNLNAGDKVQIAYYGINFKWVKCKNGRIKDQDFMVFPTLDNTYEPPSRVNLSSALGCGTTQIDFIKGITQMFNLHWTADEDTKTVFVEPYDAFYGSGKVVDWTHKIDKQNWTDKFVIEDLAKTTSFKYKVDGSDTLVTDRINIEEEKELYSLDIYNDDLYRKKENVMGTEVFSPTKDLFTETGGGNGDKTIPWSSTASNQPIVPCMWNGGDDLDWGWFTEYLRPDRKEEFNIRMLNWHGESSSTSYWKMGNDVSADVNQYSYPYAYSINFKHGADSGAIEDNLSWANKYFSGIMQRGLFDRYYGGLFQKINGGAAMRTCQMHLKAVDIAQFDYRDVIKIDMDGGVATYWTVNKIVDYQPGRNTLTKVELIEWKGNLPGDTKYRKIETNYGGFNPDGTEGVVKTPNGDTIYVNKRGDFFKKSKLGPERSMEANLSNNVTLRDMHDFSPAPKIPPLLFSKKNAVTNQPLNPKNRNNVAHDGIAFGKKLQASRGQVVVGNANIFEKNDIFQVGSGYYDDVRKMHVKQNSISVSKSGEFCVYGGEVVANLTTKDGSLTITSDVYYVDEDGNSKKLYLRNKPKNY